MGGSTHCGFIVTNRSFHPEKHILTGVTTVAGENYLQNLTFGYDDFNNLEARIDNLRNLNESFTYDNLNRLTDIELNGVQTGLMTYDDYGRMTSKTMDGQLVFQGASFDGPEGKPHAIKSAQTNEGVFPADVQKITYTSFDKVKHIAEGDNRLSYTYGYNRQRIGMEETVGGKQRNKTYVGNCEYVTETADGVTTEKVLTYLSGPTGVFAVVEKQGEEESLHYILKDHLGSWTTIADAEGNVEQELSFDAWGNLRDADTWTGTGTEAPMFDRGYTGHEHITAFGLINMNGRCYDPMMSSFLSVDEYVQDPTSAQSFNRYAYCAYNPLKYTDPTGWYSSYGNPNVAPSINPAGHTTYYPDDPAEALWGRSIHPCETGNSRRFWCTTSNFMEGNGSNYTVNKQGYVTCQGSNGQNYDMLYTEADWNGERCNGLRVDDTSILSQLTMDRDDYFQYDEHGIQHSGHYASTTDIDEAFKVFKFMSECTDVEWAIAGFRSSGPNEYVLGTTHNIDPSNNSSIYELRGSVRTFTSMPKYSSSRQIFNIHSHNEKDGTKGASSGDMDNIVNLYYAMGERNIHQWYKNDGYWTIFPKHYVYHTASHTLYHYTPYRGQNSIMIRQIISHKDLYRNLGFSR